MGICNRKRVRHLLILFFIVGMAGCQGEQFLCIHNDKFDKEMIGTTFIDEGQCQAYSFKPLKHVRYYGYNSEPRGSMEIIIGKNHDSWLSGSLIRIKENEWAKLFTPRFNRDALNYKIPHEELFNDYLGLTSYSSTHGLANARIFKFYHVDDNDKLPFYIRCFFHTKTSDTAEMTTAELTRARCTVYFSYNLTLSVSVGVRYLDLKNAKLKVSEIHQFITTLIMFESVSI